MTFHQGVQVVRDHLVRFAVVNPVLCRISTANRTSMWRMGQYVIGASLCNRVMSYGALPSLNYNEECNTETKEENGGNPALSDLSSWHEALNSKTNMFIMFKHGVVPDLFVVPSHTGSHDSFDQATDCCVLRFILLSHIGKTGVSMEGSQKK